MRRQGQRCEWRVYGGIFTTKRTEGTETKEREPGEKKEAQGYGWMP
jgi:hypothetical protein